MAEPARNLDGIRHQEDDRPDSKQERLSLTPEQQITAAEQAGEAQAQATVQQITEAERSVSGQEGVTPSDTARMQDQRERAVAAQQALFLELQHAKQALAQAQQKAKRFGRFSGLTGTNKAERAIAREELQHAQEQLQSVQERLQSESGKNVRDLESAREEVATTEAQLRSLDKLNVRRFFSPDMKTALTRQELEDKAIGAHEQYEQKRANLIGDSIEAMLAEQVAIADERALGVEAAAPRLYKLHRALGDINIANAIGWEPTSRVGRLIGRGLTMRTAINASLVGGGVLAASSGFGGAAVGLLTARSLAGRSAASVGIYDFLRMRMQTKGEKELSETNLAELSEQELNEAIADLESHYILNGKHVSLSGTHQRLLAERGKRVQERRDTNEAERIARVMSNELGVLMKGVDALTDEWLEQTAKRHSDLVAKSAAGGFVIAPVLFQCATGALKELFIGEAHAQTVEDAPAPAGDAAPAAPAPDPEVVESLEEAARAIEGGAITPEITVRIGELVVEIEELQGRIAHMGERGITSDPLITQYKEQIESLQQEYAVLTGTTYTPEPASAPVEPAPATLTADVAPAEVGVEPEAAEAVEEGPRVVVTPVETDPTIPPKELGSTNEVGIAIFNPERSGAERLEAVKEMMRRQRNIMISLSVDGKMVSFRWFSPNKEMYYQISGEGGEHLLTADESVWESLPAHQPTETVVEPEPAPETEADAATGASEASTTEVSPEGIVEAAAEIEWDLPDRSMSTGLYVEESEKYLEKLTTGNGTARQHWRDATTAVRAADDVLNYGIDKMHGVKDPEPIEKVGDYYQEDIDRARALVEAQRQAVSTEPETPRALEDQVTIFLASSDGAKFNRHGVEFRLIDVKGNGNEQVFFHPDNTGRAAEEEAMRALLGDHYKDAVRRHIELSFAGDAEVNAGELRDYIYNGRRLPFMPDEVRGIPMTRLVLDLHNLVNARNALLDYGQEGTHEFEVIQENIDVVKGMLHRNFGHVIKDDPAYIEFELRREQTPELQDIPAPFKARGGEYRPRGGARPQPAPRP